MERRDTGILAPPSGRSMGLDDTWRAGEVWLADVEGGQDESRIRVERAKGHTVRCPECGRECGACDTTRERVRGHLDIWQHGTYVHCELPRADCPEHSPKVAGVPWETGPESHLAALFEAMIAATCQSGMVASQIAGFVGEDGGAVRGILRHAVDDALASADYSNVRRVGLGGTGKAKGHTYIPAMMDLDAGRAMGVTDGNDKGSVGRLCDQLGAHGGDRAKVEEVARDTGGSLGHGVDEQMPQAARTAGRFHVTRMFSKATDKAGCAERRESDEKADMPERTKYVWPRREENPAERQAETRRALDPRRSHPGTARACQTAEAMRDLCEAGDPEVAEARPGKLPGRVMHPDVPETRKVARTVRENREGVMACLASKPANAFVEGANSIIQQIKKAARGSGNTENFRTAILLRLGGLSFDSVLSYATH